MDVKCEVMPFCVVDLTVYLLGVSGFALKKCALTPFCVVDDLTVCLLGMVCLNWTSGFSLLSSLDLTLQ